jgi:hydrogenase maturation protease
VSRHDAPRPRTLIGGVGYRWQRDASFGVVAIDALAAMEWPAEVTVTDLGYGAIYAAQDLGDAQPPYDRLILLAASERGRAPGTLYRYRYEPPLTRPDEILERVREAGAGVIDLDHLLIIAAHMQTLPKEVVVVEIEPPDPSPGIELSDAGSRLLSRAIELVKEEVQVQGGQPACRP